MSKKVYTKEQIEAINLIYPNVFNLVEGDELIEKHEPDTEDYSDEFGRYYADAYHLEPTNDGVYASKLTYIYSMNCDGDLIDVDTTELYLIKSDGTIINKN